MRWKAIEIWHEFGRTKDESALMNAIHPEAVFESPIVRTPQIGRDITFKYLIGAAAVLGGTDFRFVNSWFNDTGAVLEFQTQLEGIDINGVDIITVNAEGTLITHFKVMIRPLKAINLIHERMGAQLSQISMSQAS